VVGLGEARDGEGPRDEFAGGYVRRGRGLVGVEGSSIVARWAEGVSVVGAV
jgi:hypothetical protein